MGALGDTGQVTEAFVSLVDPRSHEEFKKFTRKHGLRSARDWLAHVNWIDFIPVDHLAEVDGVQGLQDCGLTVLRQSEWGVVVATTVEPPLVETVAEDTRRMIEVSTALWRRRVRKVAAARTGRAIKK